MGRISVSTHIAASTEDVFAAVMDLEKAAERIDGITKIEFVTDGPIGVGTRFRETRLMFGREATEEMEITRIEPGKSYTLECDSCGCHYVSKVQVAAHGRDTVVTMETQYKPVTFFAKLMSPLSKFMIGPLKKCLEKDLDDIKAHLEAQPDDGVTADQPLV